MTSNQIKNIQKFSEINYLIDSTEFISENKHINFSKFNNNSIILFEFTSDFNKLIKYLNNNKIKYTKLSDELDLEFIII